MLTSRLSPHLKKLSKKCPQIARQFIPSDQEASDGGKSLLEDPLLEENFTAVRGLVHKYSNRALVLLTLNCAAYCRFCTRRRKVSDIEKGVLLEKDLDNMVGYLKQHPEVRELVISGGDPLTVPDLLKKALSKFSKLPQIKIIRVGTRLPSASPEMIDKTVIDALRQAKKKALYLMVHFEHPEEINLLSIQAIHRLQKVSTMVFSQSVFLKGINDSAETLYNLFSGLIEIGVKPYYIFRCDPVKGAEHFIVDFEKEVKIMTELRRRLSGLACPMYVIDAPDGSGKIPVPLNFWEFNKTEFEDFEGKKEKII